MKTYFLLLSPRVLSLRNRIKGGEEGSTVKLAVMGVIALLFWLGIFLGFFKALSYFHAVEGFGQVLARKLMGMTLLSFFAILVFSNIITALSAFYLSKDLEIIHASPTSLENLFWARFTDTLVDSSWMVFFFGLPVFLAYGLVFKAGFLFYLNLVMVTVPYVVIAGAIGVMFIMFLVNIFPAQRTKDILLLLSIFLVIILYLLLRMMRPERLVNPDAFTSVMSYLSSLRTPASPYLPSHWVTEVLWPRLVPGIYSEAVFYYFLLISTAGALSIFASWLSNSIYGYGFSKSQEASRRIIIKHSPLDWLAGLMGRPFSSGSRALIAKDVKTFFRDNTQWSQILLLFALVVIYLYNFSVLPLKNTPFPTFYLQNFISFLNIGLAAFVVASLGVRFVFPAVSQEGFSYWIIRSSPITLKRFLWTKYWVSFPPLLIVAEILIIVSNYLLDATLLMMIISSVTIFVMVFGITSLGVGLGAVYPRFETENIVQVATGFGGLTFMILSAIYVGSIVVLEAWPVYTIFVSQINGSILPQWKLVIVGLCFVAILVINIVTIYLPMRIGLSRLALREGD